MDVKKWIKYVLFAFLGAVLLYYTYQGISWDELVEIGSKVKIRWIVLAVIAHLVNHWLRAFRWRLFVEVQEYYIAMRRAFIAEMSGFCMNLIPPRMGDWMRCVILKRLERIPISKSLGGLVVERFIDIFLFLCLFFLAFFIELFRPSKVFSKLGSQLSGVFTVDPRNWKISVVGGVLVCLVVILYKFHKSFAAIVWQQIKFFSKEVFEAIRETRKCNGIALWATSLFVLFFHFLVEYLSFFAIEDIDINLQGALLVFIAMNIGMAAPTPGGIGMYHLGVISTLTALGVEKRYAIVYATITHSIQLFNAFVVGGISFLCSTFLKPKKEAGMSVKNAVKA